MINREQAAKLRMGDKLIAYRNAHVRMGEATPVEFEPGVVLGVPRENPQVRQMENFAADAPGDPAQAEELRSCRIMVAFNDGTTQMLRGGRLFLTMTEAYEAVETDILDIERMTNAVGAAWDAYFNANADIDRGPGHVNCPCKIEPRETKDEDEREHGYGDAPLHRLWTKAVGTEGYDKAEWRDLEALVHAGIAARKPAATAETSSVEKVYAMGSESLSPEAFEALEKVLTELIKTRRIGSGIFKIQR